MLVDAGVAVNVFVSSGPQPVAVPNVKGQLEAAAREALTKVGLAAEVEYVNLATGDASIGKVISQGTPVGSMVTPGTAVGLTIGRDAATAPVG